MRKHLALLVAALLCACCVGLAACGGGTASSSGSAASSGAGSAASGSVGAIDAASLKDSTWQCTGVVSKSDGKTYELNDVLNAYVMSIHFFGEDEVRVYVDTNFTIMKWKLDGDTLTFTGDSTYSLTVQDGGKKLVWADFQGTGYDLEFEEG